MQKKKRVLAFLSLLSFAACSGCVTVPPTKPCFVAGKLDGGMICGDTFTGQSFDLSLYETIDFLEPQFERECTIIPGTTICADLQTAIKNKIAARAGAVCQSSEDYAALKTALEEACREMGSKCSKAAQMIIQHQNELEVIHAMTVPNVNP